MQQQNRGIGGVTAEEVFIGNGVSELIDLSLRALLNPGDEVLVPSPDYPLWSASVALNGGIVRHYRCAEDNRFLPDIDHMEGLVNSRTKAVVVINPNNPSGAVYDRETLQKIVELAEKHGLVVMSDEIYDRMVYDEAKFIPLATLATDTVCLTFPAFQKSIAPAVTESAGACSAVILIVPPTISTAWSYCPRCDCAAMCPASGRCKRRSAGFKVSIS